jgi:hypothetical protein
MSTEPHLLPMNDARRVPGRVDAQVKDARNTDLTAGIRFGQQPYDEMITGHFDRVPDRPVRAERRRVTSP